MNKEDYTIHTDIVTSNYIIEKIKEIDSKIIELAISFKEKKWESYDTRFLLLQFLHELNTNTIIGFCYQSECISISNEKNWWLEKFPHKKDVILSQNNFNQFSKERNDSFFKYLHDNYVINFYFEFETRIRNLVREIKEVKNINKKSKKVPAILEGDEAFYFISEGFFKNYLEFYIEDYEVVKIYSEIRNTIHNSGFYFPPDKKDKTLIFKGSSYTFKNEAPVNFIDYKLTFQIISALVDLIDITLNHNKIQKFRIIPDTFSKINWIED